MQKITSKSPEETKNVARRLIRDLSQRKIVRGTSTIIALEGNLGAGKTVFVKGAAKELGVVEEVTSPTFVIEKIYSLPKNSSWKKLVHVDAYRLSNEKELTTIGWHDLATDPNNIIMIEWPEQVGLGVPERAVWISFENIDENTRMIHSSVPIKEHPKHEGE